MPIIPSSIRHLDVVARAFPDVVTDARRWMRGMDEVEELVNFGIAQGDLVQPARLVRAVSPEENLGDIIRQLYQGQGGLWNPGEAVEYALVRLRNDIDFSHPDFIEYFRSESFIDKGGRLLLSEADLQELTFYYPKV